MECNKDEACRAKEVAVEKMVRNEFEAARKFALKAKQLFPELDNISQIIAVCDVHCSAQKMIYNGGKDLYGILQVENVADETSIRKQYRKLALVLHPDKNKFPGAEAAFKLIGEAHMTLSDKEKRSVYDIKCRQFARPAVTKVQNRQGNQTSNAGQNKFNYGQSTKFNGLNHAQHSASKQNIRLTFWTYCVFCTIKYEYNREHVNKPLRCQHCSKIFIAYDYGAPSGAGTSFVNEKSANLKSKPVSQQKEAEKSEKVKVNKQEGATKSKSANLGSKPVSQQKEAGKSEKVKVKGNKQEGVTKSNANVQKPMETGTVKGVNKKRGRKTEEKSNESRSDESEVTGGGLGGNSVNQRRSSRQKQHVSYREDGDDEFSPQKRSKPNKPSNEVEDMKNENVSGCEDTSDNISESDSEPELVDCPEQEFCNFDKDKEAHCFAVDQIWACYDSLDDMPRFYAQINKVYSSGFRLRFTWLESEPTDDLETKWVEEGLPVACGEFALGETDETRDRLMFSHQIVYNKKDGSKFSYVVSPQKGETWALYKDWDIKWSSDPESHMKFRFDMVEILSVHDDWVTVAFLLKVKGFVSVFQRGVAEHTIPSNERFRFSHRIPSAKLTGTERAGVPTGSFELDMASLPSDFEDYCHYYSKVNDGQSSSSGHNFRSDKQISKFQVGQIWAYWEQHANGIRQCYAQIKKIEHQSFKLHVSLLNLCDNPCNGSSACGLFKLSGKRKVLAANTFSHIVKAEAFGKKSFNIHPKEQQIWALCKRQEDAGECEIVEVVGTDAVSINVMSLTRVFGSTSVFMSPRTQSSTGKIVVIPRVELNRFSRQIPAFRFTDDCLRSCWELDPAALTGLHLVEPNQC
ncbi:putative DnaJ domain, Chaperone J-domain superfamily [Helianthus annuus]|nr:putative DnaJ domain, Chaperone J-domain superfamily [Helianthus annuus]KAJ0832411.1 putative DnaJ domain, Chaperone J-domain superfamily [Helianthus annuus]